jgi:hypothetical protein
LNNIASNQRQPRILSPASNPNYHRVFFDERKPGSLPAEPRLGAEASLPNHISFHYSLSAGLVCSVYLYCLSNRKEPENVANDMASGHGHVFGNEHTSPIFKEPLSQSIVTHSLRLRHSGCFLSLLLTLPPPTKTPLWLFPTIHSTLQHLAPITDPSKCPSHSPS